MTHLVFLRLLLGFWQHTLSISKKLGGRTWLALAVIHTAIALVAFEAYFAKSVSDSAIPPVHYVDTDLASAPFRPCIQIARQTVCVSDQDLIVGRHTQYIDFLPRSPDPALTALSVSPDRRISSNPPQVDAKKRAGAANTTRSNGSGSTGDGGQPLLRIVTDGPNLPSELFYGDIKVKPLRLLPTSVSEKITKPAATISSASLTWHDLSRWLPRIPVSSDQIAFHLGIFNTFFAALNVFFSWQVYRRSKAQEILLQLQIAKLQAEIAEYKAKADKESAATGIILVS